MNHLKRLIAQLDSRNITHAFISKKETLTYLFDLPAMHPTEREAYGFITPTETVLYHSPFISPPRLPSVTLIPMTRAAGFTEVLPRYFKGAKVIGIEAENMTVAERKRLQSLIADQVEFEEIDDLAKDIIMIKDADEIKKIRNAITITKKVIRWIESFIYSKEAIGITEIQMQHLIDDRFYTFGSHGTAFPTIVAFDDHAALPHHLVTTRKLKPNSIVLVDMGARYKHYDADMTRTWHLGARTPLFKKIEKTVLAAYKAAAMQVKVNTPASHIDKAARDIITHAGFGPNFIHTTGHGLGLEAHEPPSLNPLNNQEIKAGMVITIEPGIYLPGKFGYRFENTLIVT